MQVVDNIRIFNKELNSDVQEKNYHTDYKHYSAIIEGQVNTIQ